MDKKYYTVVQHSAFAFKQDKTFERGVQLTSISTQKEIDKVKKAGGVIFEDYNQCDDYCHAEMYTNVTGFVPKVNGTFSKSTIDDMRIYIPAK